MTNTIRSLVLMGSLILVACGTLPTPSTPTQEPIITDSLAPTDLPVAAITEVNPTLPPTTPPIWNDWKILLKEDFGDTSNKGCLPISNYDDEWKGDMSISNGEYIVQGIRVKADGAVWQVSKLDCLGILNNFYIKFDMRFSSSNPNTTGGIALWSSKDTGNYYLFEFKNNGDYRTRIYTKYSGINLNGDWVNSQAIKSNDWNTVEAVTDNNRIEILVNGQVVTEITDRTYNSGYLGLFVRFMEQKDTGLWEFDNVEVRVP